MKRQSFITIVVLLFVIVLIPAANVYANEITVRVNGQPVIFADQNPVIVDGRTLVPVAGVFQALGFEVEWNQSERQALITKDADRILITIGSTLFNRNGVDLPLDVPAQIIGERTMLPLRAVLESVGYDLGWDGATNTVMIASMVTILGVRYSTALDSLDLNNMGLTGSDIEPLRYMWNLTALNLSGNIINDLTPLAALTNLNILSLSDMDLTDIEPLRYMMNLTTLDLSGNMISDLTPLTALTNLNTLSLNDMDLTDIESLRYTMNLTALDLSGNMISDLTPLTALTNLNILFLNDMDLTDENILSLQHMGSLAELSLVGNRIRNLTPLSNLLNLMHLSLDNNMIRDFTHVEHVANTIRGQQRLSSIVLPDRRLTTSERNEWIADYLEHGGPTEVELEVVRLINIERANHDLSQVQIDDALMMAARYFAQQANDLRGLYSGSHNFGPYASNPSARHGASANVASAFGGNLRWNGGNWFSGGSMSAENLVSGWMNSDGHRRYILSPEHRFIGMGQYPGGISYLFLSANAGD